MGDRTITDEQFRAVLNLRGILNRAVDDLERLAIELEGDGPEIETVIARLFEWARICQKAQGGPQEIRQAELDAMVLQHGAHPDAAFVSELATLDEWIGVPRDSEEAEQAPPNRDGESMCKGCGKWFTDDQVAAGHDCEGIGGRLNKET